jgi:pimeloyl-ACP methyl ester carboxylesterase
MRDLVRLSTGAEVRIRNGAAPIALVLLNGGSARPVPGTWSATSELLASELASRFEGIAFTEVRYRIKSWKALDSCLEDAVGALDLVDRPALLVGFSMGGAVSIGVAGDPRVVGVLGLAPWIPEELPLDGLIGKRLDVLHGSWDRYLPGIPGVSASSSRRGFDRARALGVEGTYTLIPRGLHGAALRRRSGAIQRLPRSRAWIDGVSECLALYSSQASFRRAR